MMIDLQKLTRQLQLLKNAVSAECRGVGETENYYGRMVSHLGACLRAIDEYRSTLKSNEADE